MTNVYFLAYFQSNGLAMPEEQESNCSKSTIFRIHVLLKISGLDGDYNFIVRVCQGFNYKFSGSGNQIYRR